VPEVWKIDFYTRDDGSLPVRNWLDTVPQDVRGKVLARIELLRTGGPTLDYPYTSQIEGKLREARLRVGKTRYRVLYFFDEDRTASSCMASRKPPQPLRNQTRRSDALGWPATRPNWQQEPDRSPQHEHRQRRTSANEECMGQLS